MGPLWVTLKNGELADTAPPSPDWECNDCGEQFDIARWAQAFCPHCDSEDVRHA